MHFDSLQDWLSWQETLHPVAIDLGLDRFREALRRLRFTLPTCPVITIAGTKGKGSCASLLDHLYRAAGYRTALFTSPHLHVYNERIRINGEMVSDALLCNAFERIEAVRGELSLTYFEFNALAAFLIFAETKPDVWIVEVGMGGRLDAANALDADVAIVTSIGLDHVEWLGNDLNSIGREKAGIARPGKPLVFGATAMPDSIAEVAAALPAPLFRQGQQFGFKVNGDTWSWWGQVADAMQRHDELPMPGISGAVQLFNASTALMAMQLLSARLPFKHDALVRGFSTVTLSGRFQRHIDARGTEWVLDVAHNAMSAAVLADHLAQLPPQRVITVLGLMADKDLDGMIAALNGVVDAYIAVALPGTRPMPVAALAARIAQQGGVVLANASDMRAACTLADSDARSNPGTRIVVCGSFMTVGPALQYLGLEVRA